jgi:glycosyltransferase involved in cell wall biosynthesis
MSRRSRNGNRMMSRFRVWAVGGDDHDLRIPFLRRLAELGFEVTAVGSGAPEPFARADVPYLHYPLHRFLDLLADVRSLRRLTALIRERRPDLVHGFDTKPSLLVPLAVTRAGIGHAIRTINGLGYVFSSHAPLALALRPVYRALQRHVAPRTAMTVFQNSHDLSYFQTEGMVRPGSCRLIPGSGIDIAQLRAAMPGPEQLARLCAELQLEGKTVVTTVARLTREKGILELLEAAAVLHRRHPDLLFLLVGPRESEGPFAVPAAAIDRHRDYVRALGPRRDVPALLALTDIFVLATYREGLSRVLLEAMAAGRAIVTTRVPGCTDLIRDGWNGFLVAPKESGELAQAIERLVECPPLRLEMGGRSASIVDGFSLERVVQEHADLYCEVMGRYC